MFRRRWRWRAPSRGPTSTGPGRGSARSCSVLLLESRGGDEGGSARVASVGTCVAVVFVRAHAPREPVSRWLARGSPVAAGAFVGFALMLCISVSEYKHASAVELGLGVGSFVSWARRPASGYVGRHPAAALAAGFVLLLLPIQVHPPGGKQGLTAVLGSLAWAGVRRLLCRPPDARG